VARFPVSLEKEQKLLQRMERLGIKESELVEKFIKGSGKGGQKSNKTSSCVYLHHLPSQIEVKCQQCRSQALNRFVARQELCDVLEERLLGEFSKRQQAREKIRRQKRKRSKRQKEKILAGKQVQSQKKTLRKPVRDSRD